MPAFLIGILGFLGGTARVAFSQMLGISIAMVSFKLILAYVLKLFGVGVVSYVGFNMFLNAYSNQIWDFLQFDSFGQNIAGILRLDQIVSLWLSALNVKVAMMSWMKLRIGQQRLPL